MINRPKILRNSSKAWEGKTAPCPAFIRSCALVLGFGVGVSLAAAPAAAQSSTQHMEYNVYAGGIHAVKADLDIIIDEDKDRYEIALASETRGFLSKIVPWESLFETHGWILDGGEFQPEIHKSYAKGKETDVKEYFYNKDGTFEALHITDKHSDREKRDVEQELTDHTVDGMTAALSVLQEYNKTQTCEGSSEVFDGKRRYRQSFKPVKKTTLSASKYNLAQGPAAECIVEVTPLAGQWHEKPRGWMSIQEQGRERGTMPTVWIGRLAEDGPAVPLKIRVKTAYGTLFMHLAHYENKDSIITAEKHME